MMPCGLTLKNESQNPVKQFVFDFLDGGVGWFCSCMYWVLYKHARPYEWDAIFAMAARFILWHVQGRFGPMESGAREMRAREMKPKENQIQCPYEMFIVSSKHCQSASNNVQFHSLEQALSGICVYVESYHPNISFVLKIY